MHAHLFISTRGYESLVPEFKSLLPEVKNIYRFPIQKLLDVKDLLQFTNISQKEKSLLVLENFDKATVEAQNAFLKRLEEPLPNVNFALIANNENRILETILSRTNIIYMPERQSIDKADVNNALIFSESGISEKFAATSKITKREDAQVFLTNLIAALHQVMPEKPVLMKTLANAEEALSRINQNANSTLQLIRFCIHSSLQ